DRDDGQGLIHRQHEISGSINAAPVFQGLREKLTQHDPDVFYRVVLVDVEVALSVEFQVESAVLGEQLQHVIKETNARRDFIAALTLQAKASADARLFRVALDRRPAKAHSVSSI